MWEAERCPTDEYRSEKSTPIFLFLQGVLLAVGRLSAFALFGKQHGSRLFGRIERHAKG